MTEILHSKYSLKTDGADRSLVLPSDWNAKHVDENGNIIDIEAIVGPTGPQGPTGPTGPAGPGIATTAALIQGKGVCYFPIGLNTYYYTFYNSKIDTNRIFALPFIPSNNITIDRFVTYVSVGNSGTKLTVGVYSDNGSVYPSSLIGQGEIDCSSSGMRYVATNISLSKGTLYWIATLGTNPDDGGQIAIHVSGWLAPLGIRFEYSTRIIWGYCVTTYSYAPLPDPFPSFNEFDGAGTATWLIQDKILNGMPLGMFRVA